MRSMCARRKKGEKNGESKEEKEEIGVERSLKILQL